MQKLKTKMLTIITLSLLIYKSLAQRMSQQQTKYLACTNIPHVIFMVNNNSISTSTPDNKYLYIAVTAKITQIYRYPIKQSTTLKLNQQYQYISDEPYQNLKQSTQSSSVIFTNDGKILAVGCGNSNINIYQFNGNQYIFVQSIKNAYYKNGAKLLFSSDNYFLFSIQSAKQIMIFIKGANMYQVWQNIQVNLQAITLFSLTKDNKYFSIIERNSTSLILSVYMLQNFSSKYLKLGHSQPISQLVSSLSMNNNFIAITIGTLPTNCSTLLYRISNDGFSYKMDQQIFITSNLCITSLYLSNKNQLILTNPYTTSYIYKYSDQPHVNHFIKQYQLYHEALGAPVHTQVRLEDTKYQHLLIYTGVEIDIFCPGIQTAQYATQ